MDLNELKTLYRAVENPLDAYTLGQDPLVTSLVLGTPQLRQMPSRQILKPIGVDSITFKWFGYGVERLKAYDTERALRAEIRHSDWTATTNTDSLKRYSWSVPKDVAELANSHPSLRVAELSARMARDIVMLNIEMLAATLLTTVTNYPVSHRLALGAGSEFDAAGGDSNASIQTIVDAICDDTGLQPMDLQVFLPNKSYRAALQDPVFRAIRGYQTTQIGNAATLAEYWGVGGVFTGNIRTADEDNAVSDLYGDVAIVFYPGMGADYDTTYGDQQFGATFSWNKGMALERWFDPKTTTWYFPWEEWVKHGIINSSCGGIITNCAA